MLGSLIGKIFDYWIENSNELVYRIHKDTNCLYDIFGIPANSNLISIKHGLSDFHCDGRSVSILTFKDEYLSLLPNDDRAKEVANAAITFEEFVMDHY